MGPFHAQGIVLILVLMNPDLSLFENTVDTDQQMASCKAM